jgi:hypothetical protein
MADMRRSGPEPEPSGPQVQWVPGLAEQMMAELAPLLAEDGIDLSADVIDVDLATLQAAMARATERYNLALSTPVGEQRDWCTSVLRLVAETISCGETAVAASILDTVEPESPDGKATVAGVIGVATGLLDTWLTRPPTGIPKKALAKLPLPQGHWIGERAAIDLLALARKGKAFDSHDTVLIDHGGYHVLFGAALAVTAVLAAWAAYTGEAVADLARTHLH